MDRKVRSCVKNERLELTFFSTLYYLLDYAEAMAKEIRVKILVPMAPFQRVVVEMMEFEWVFS